MMPLCLPQAGLQLAPGIMQSLHINYTNLASQAVLQPLIAEAAAMFLKLAKVALLSKE